MRFKEFEDEFANEKFSNLVSFARSGGTPKSGEHKYYQNGTIPFLSINDMKEKYLVKCSKKITDLAIKETSTFLFEKNNILLSIYATIGEIAINKIDVALPQSILGIKITKNIDLEYFYYLLLSGKKGLLKHSQIGSQPNLSLKIVNNIHFKFTTNKLEQKKISGFLGLLDKQISLLENKLKLTEQAKEYYKNTIFKSFFKHSKKQEFNKIFKRYRITANNKLLKQVTIGKKGLNIINETNYKINKHKIIETNSLIIGIGIEEINFNLNLENICCSPIYQTYKLNNEFNNIFIYHFISKIISKKRNLISKKSTRREHEIIIKDLEKLKMPIPNDQEQYKFGNLMLNLDLVIQKLNNKIKLTKKRKLFYITNLFI